MILENKAEYSALDASRRRLREGVTDLWTDGPTDGQTDRPSYRDARTHLKKDMNHHPYISCLSSHFLDFTHTTSCGFNRPQINWNSMQSHTKTNRWKATFKEKERDVILTCRAKLCAISIIVKMWPSIRELVFPSTSRSRRSLAARSVSTMIIWFVGWLTSFCCSHLVFALVDQFATLSFNLWHGRLFCAIVI